MLEVPNIETSANQWTSFYMVRTSLLERVKDPHNIFEKHEKFRHEKFQFSSLTHIMPLVSFYTPENIRKPVAFFYFLEKTPVG